MNHSSQDRQDIMMGKAVDIGEDLRKRGRAIEIHSEEMVILTDFDYSSSDKKASEMAALEKGIKDYWRDMKLASHKAWKLQCRKEEEMLAPVQYAKRLITSKMSEYRYERGRIEAEKREAEQNKNREIQEIEAFKLAEEGLPAAAVDAIMEQAAESNVQMAPSVQELRGKTSFSVDYEVELVAGDEHKIPLEILLPTTKGHIAAVLSKAKAQAKLTGGKPIPGIKIIQIEKAKTRSS